MSDIKHTELPYYVAQDGSRTKVMAKVPGFDSYQVLAECRVPEKIMGGIETFPSEANAEFIVRACNSHYKLLEIGKRSLEQRSKQYQTIKNLNLKFWQPDDAEFMYNYEQDRAAINKAEAA